MAKKMLATDDKAANSANSNGSDLRASLANVASRNVLPTHFGRKKKVTNVTAIKRRPSFEIAEDYVEMNFKAIIDAEAEASMTKKELRAKKKLEKKQNRRHHILRNSIIALLVLALLAVVSATMWWTTSTEPVNRADKNTYQFEVDQGATADEVATALRKAGFIRNTLAFRLYVRLNGNTIQAGTHVLSPSYDLAGIVDRLAKADTDEVDVQIPPGLTLSELKETLKKYDYTESEIDAALNATYDSPILADRPAGATLEGYLYPDTYRIYAGDKVEVIINKALQQFEKVAEENDLEASFKARGLTMYEGITLASIVTKEVKDTTDQKKVAGVFYNRLNAGMNLGSDVTFQYAYKAGLCQDNSPSCDSAYNTRINEGLPPGPIANPSLSALLAVANPEESNNYYFVAGDDGKTYYSQTEDQHNAAVAEHCKELCQ